MLTHELTRGGRAKSSVDLTCALALVGYQVVCVAHPRFGVPEHSKKELSDAGAELCLLPPGRVVSPVTVGRVIRALRNLRPDVVIAHSGPRVGLIAPLKRLYGDPQFVFIKRGFWRPRGAWAGPLRLASRHVDAVVAVSRAVAHFWAQCQPEWDSSRLHVLPNGVRVPPLEDIPPASLLRGALGLPDGTRLVGTVGRLGWPKGHRDLIRALPLILRRIADAHLVLVGDGPDLRDLRRLAKNAGLDDRVHFLGWREDIYTALAAMDVFVHTTAPEHPSGFDGTGRGPAARANSAPARESFGRTIVEASAAGVPVVAADAGGPREVVVDGVTGTLVHPGDPEAICSAVVDLLTNPDRAQAMAHAARERACGEYSLEALGRRYHGLIQRLLAE